MTATTRSRDTALDWHRHYPSHPRSVPQARRDAEQALRAWDCPEDSIDTAVLITSELTTNAVTHGHRPGRTFELRLRLIDHALTVEVSDAGPVLPGPVDAEMDAEHGRGLALITALTGSRPDVTARWPVGKTVQTTLALDGCRAPHEVARP